MYKEVLINVGVTHDIEEIAFSRDRHVIDTSDMCVVVDAAS